MAKLLSDTVITLSKELVEMSSGLGFDIGGSIAKIVYRSNKEYQNGVPIDPKAHEDGKGSLHLAMFLREDIDEIIRYILDNCDIRRNDDGPTLVYATGVGGSENKDKFNEKLNITITVNEEFAMFVKAFIRLSDCLPNDEFVHPKSEVAKQKAATGAKMIEEYTKKAQEKGMELHFVTAKAEDSEEEDKGNHLPAILCMCGSGTGLMLVKEDGSFTIIDGVFSGGRFFLGLMNQLIGIKDFSQLMDMAEKSDGRTVDTYISDLQLSDADDDAYNMIKEHDELVYAFGKGYSKKQGEPKKGDMVWSALNMCAYAHVQGAMLNAAIYKAKNVYFCGNFVNAPLHRELMEIWQFTRESFVATPIKHNLNFLQNGGMYGALGCYFFKPEEDSKTEEANKPE